jgi:hypothetical protein
MMRRRPLAAACTAHSGADPRRSGARRFLVAWALLFVVLWLTSAPAVWAQKAAAGAAQAPGQGVGTVALPALAIAFVIAIVPYIMLNTLLAWIASNMMSFPQPTVGRALKLSVLQILLPLPLGIVTGWALYHVFSDQLAAREDAAFWSVVYCVLGGIIVSWMVSVLITAAVYAVGFLRAAVFNTLLWVLYVGVGFLTSCGGFLSGCGTFLQSAANQPTPAH